MIIEITSSQFRNEQKKYLELADKGTKVLIRRGNKRSYMLTPVNDDELNALMLDKINHSLAQAKAGNVKELKNKEDIDKLLGRH